MVSESGAGFRKWLLKVEKLEEVLGIGRSLENRVVG